jgi:undecaprenyl-diphosphatase
LRFDPTSVRFVRNLLVAFLPAAVIGLVLHKQIEKLLGSPLTVAIALIVGGIAIIGIERTVKEGRIKGVAEIPLSKVVAIGFIQCLAMIPGVSRSGATILGALSLGVERRTAAEFSFFLAIPTMLGATVLELVTKRHELMAANSVGFELIAIGFVVAFVVALLVVRWFVGLVGKTGFSPFGWYRIAVGALALVFLLK